MKRSGKFIFLFGVLIVVVTLVNSFFVYNKKKSYALKTPMDVTFAPKWVNQSQFAGVFVAKDLGYFSDFGLNVSVKEFKLGDSVVNELERGMAHFGLMSANEFLVYRSRGKKIKAIAAFYQTSPFMLASLKSNPVKSPIELKGKRLGIKGGIGAEGYLEYELLLNTAGLTDNDVQFVELPFGDSESKDLATGKVDVIGFYRDVLYFFNKDEVSYEPLYPERYGSALYNDVLVVTEDFLEKHPDAVKAFLKATIDGWQYAYKNKERAVEITLSYTTSEMYKDIDYLRYILNKSEELMVVGEVSIGSMDMARWRRYYDLLLSRKLIDKPFDLEQSITMKFIP